MYSRKILGGHFALRLGVTGHEKSHFHFARFNVAPNPSGVFLPPIHKNFLSDSKTGTLRTLHSNF